MSETIRQTLARASAALAEVSDSARLDAELLLCQTLNCTRSRLFSHADDTLNAAQAAQFTALLARRQHGEPVAYLLGHQEFWSLKLAVSDACLVPRADTECLVDWALSLPGDALQVLDLGTGSGAIAIALASERPGWRVSASDASAAALHVAQRNAQTHKVAVNFAHGSWFEPLAGQRFDLIVSNPPYIAEGDAHLADLHHEPQSALTSGADGLDAIRHIASHASAHLHAGAHMALEHGYDQAQRVREILSAQGFQTITTAQDLAGRDRYTHAQWKGA